MARFFAKRPEPTGLGPIMLTGAEEPHAEHP